MQKQDIFRSLQETVEKLAVDHAIRYPYIPLFEKQLPETKALISILEILRTIMFPGYFGSPLVNINSVPYHTGVNVEKLYDALSEQIYRTLTFSGEVDDLCKTKETACELSEKFIGRLPEVKRLLSTDVNAIHSGDPAAKDYTEVIFCYPAMRALLNYRVAHELLNLGIPLIPRIISEIAHSETGIDIHPGAKIGEYFSIDHGTGVVIGQTTIIGKHVRLYQGVTLGAKSFTLDDEGNPIDVPRHPILEDHVTVYSNSSILGRITIGEGTIVGGNVWLTHSVPPNSRILQSKFVE
ncbi:MAG: serine acetyltransferase [Bacteroidales bacterium]|jgi:serine O-acetyltransferase|nr:serine acetyltransferase [Bacteroidales bacterium]